MTIEAVGATRIAPGVWTQYTRRGSSEEKTCFRCEARTSFPTDHEWAWTWAPDHQSTISCCRRCYKKLVVPIRKPRLRLMRNGGAIPPLECGNCKASASSLRIEIVDHRVAVMVCLCGWNWYLTIA